MIDITWRENLFLHVSRRITRPLEEFIARWKAPRIARIHRDVMYARHVGVNLLLDVCVPRTEAPRPVVLMIHGGGFIMGDKRQLERTCLLLADAGFLTVNINYRLAPEYPHPAAVEDCAAALQWVKDNAADYGGDPQRVCVGGGSAGAYLAAALAVKAQDGPYRIQPHPLGEQDRDIDGAVQAALLLNGVFDLETLGNSPTRGAQFMGRAFLGDAHTDAESWRRASPINFVSEKFPPAFIGVGTRDPIYRDSAAMRDALAAHGVDVTWREYAGSTHGWFNWFWTANAQRAHADMIAWLKAQFGPSGL